VRKSRLPNVSMGILLQSYDLMLYVLLVGYRFHLLPTDECGLGLPTTFKCFTMALSVPLVTDECRQ
jgi:hypothetical protein